MSKKVSYNGIPLYDEWPLQADPPASFQPMRVPYLENPPEVIDIDVGRQLFVDDFLVEENHMVRKFHHPVKYPGNPVLFPETEYEFNDEKPPCTVPKCGGVWYDDLDNTFKMWYMCSYLGVMAYATSQDGVNWVRPELDVVPGTNLVLPPDMHPDSGTVWIDKETQDPNQRYKMLFREPNPLDACDIPALMMTSADGIHWSKPVKTGPMDDRSTMFYNPFRKKWVQSIRSWINPYRRSRSYWEADDFIESGNWKKWEPPFWTKADCLDIGGDSAPELYNLDAAPYESLLISFHQILKGPPNHIGEAVGMPKLTELTFATSRDGFHWHRPDRTSFIGARREPGSWEYGYVEATGGICLVVGDELWFYYSSYGGAPDRLHKNWRINGTYANGAAGLAKLRRDGFASIQARFPGGTLTTRLLKFSGNRFFINANTPGELVKVECLDENNEVIAPFTKENCEGFKGNSTCSEIRWKGVDSLAALAGRPVKFRFHLDRGDIYSFWVTSSPKGASGGYLAAGGPGFSGSRDI